MTTRKAVVEEAKKWLRTPYHHQGRVMGVGVDCAMLLAEVYHATNLVPYIDPTPYPHDWHMHRDEERYLGWVKQYGHAIDAPESGDVALFQFGRCVSHGAIVVEWPVIIHAYFREGVVLADANLGALAGRFRAAYSLFKDVK